MSIDSQWHIQRSQEILRQHPEIRQYFGNCPLSILSILLLVTLQWLTAWLVKDLPWFAVGAIAFLVGQFVLHSLGVFVDEAAHNLIFKSKLGSKFALWLIICGSLSFGESLTYIGVHGIYLCIYGDRASVSAISVLEFNLNGKQLGYYLQGTIDRRTSYLSSGKNLLYL